MSPVRPGALSDAVGAGVCGILFAGMNLLPALIFVRSGDFGLDRLLPLLLVATAWSALAARIVPGAGAAAWSVALGSVLLPTILPGDRPLLRASAAAAALILGATLVDHPPTGAQTGAR
jgi:hypothetical protein